MTPDQFTLIKSKIQTSPILSEQERREWLFLLPKMSETETKELDRILSVKMPITSPPARLASESVAGRQPSPHEERVKDIDHPHRGFLRHLLEHKGKDQNGEERIPARLRSEPTQANADRTTPLPVPLASPSLGRSGPPQGEGRTPRRPDIISSAPPQNIGLTNITRWTAGEIRKPPSIYVCLENLHKGIDELLDKTDISAPQILAAFEKSPLYRDYLQSGIKFINRDETAPLSHEEFEALTDFRSSLKKYQK